MDISNTKATTMNHLSKFCFLLILVSITALNSSCDGSDDPDKSEEEIQLDKLKAATWQLISANDGNDRTNEYPGMTLTFSGTFTSAGTYAYTSSATSWPSASPWKEDDSWKFVSGSVTNKIIRLSDDTEMTYALANSDKQLTISFNYAGPGFNNGRVEEVEGDWVFTFTRP
jgi:hypothetical protein